jgi:hypothetical protein
VFLREIAERNDDDGGKDLGHRGIKMKVLHEKLDENIVEVDTNQHQQQVSKQLYPAF